MFVLIVAFILCFGLALCLAPFIISLAKKVGARQNILQYVTTHFNKQGTPTMGGLIFMLPTIFIVLVLNNGQSTLTFVALGVMAGFGMLGFLDDFIKVHTHKNLGLRAYQKIIGQFGIATIVAIFVFIQPLIGGSLNFCDTQFDIGWVIIPLVIFVLLAMTNSANLTDGLDGLAGWTSLIMLIGLAVILDIELMSEGQSLDYVAELKNLELLCVALSGALLAFLCFNSYPATVFMGDTGSLALGGVIATIAIFCRATLILPILCLVFVVSAISVIIQVVHFKRTGKRIFLMAPLHHHFEKRGMNEDKIVVIYIVVTIIGALVSILLFGR